MLTLTREQAQQLDRRAVDGFGMSGLILMENAGRGVADWLRELNPNREQVTILCGPGNNGGDGFVIARHLDNHGWPVHVLVLAKANPGTPTDADANFDILYAAGIPFTQYNPEHLGEPQFQHLQSKLQPPKGWIVDALFGTGLSRALASPYAAIVDTVNQSQQHILAVDIPSGMDCDTGEPLGPTIRASHTATFAGLKKGFLNEASQAYIGEVKVIDIGVPRVLLQEFESTV